MQNFDYMAPTCLVFGIDATLPKQEIAEKAIDATYAFFESINIKEILLASL